MASAAAFPAPAASACGNDNNDRMTSERKSPTSNNPAPLLRDWSHQSTLTPVAVAVSGDTSTTENDSNGDGDRQQPYPVATFVSNLATNLRSSFDQLHSAVIAERVEEFDGEDGDSAQRDPPDASGSAFPPFDDWVVNDFDEAEFHVVDGELIEVRTPVPSMEDERYEDAFLKNKKCVSITGVRRNAKRLRKWMKKRRDRKNHNHNADRTDPPFVDEDAAVSSEQQEVPTQEPPAGQSRRGWGRGNKHRRRRHNRDPTSPDCIPPSVSPSRRQRRSAQSASVVPVAPVSQTIGGRPVLPPSVQIARLVQKSEHGTHAAPSKTEPLPFSTRNFDDALAEKMSRLSHPSPGVSARSDSTPPNVTPSPLSKSPPKDRTLDKLLRDIDNAILELEDEEDFPPLSSNNKQNSTESAKRLVPPSLADSQSSLGSSLARKKISVGAFPSGRSYTKKPFSSPPLKVVFVGAPNVGKSSLVSFLTDSSLAKSSVDSSKANRDLQCYTWQPSHPSTGQNDCITDFTVWDLPGSDFQSGAHHATHSVFFSPSSFYVLVWDMGAKNPKTWRPKDQPHTAETDFESEEKKRRADRALERDIQDKVLYWIDCIRKIDDSQGRKSPSTILPVASFSDVFDAMWGESETRRRCSLMKSRIARHLDQAAKSSPHSPVPNVLFDVADCDRSIGGVIQVNATDKKSSIDLEKVIMSAANNVPRREYKPTEKECKITQQRSVCVRGSLCFSNTTTELVRASLEDFRRERHMVVKVDQIVARLLQEQDETEDNRSDLSEFGPSTIVSTTEGIQGALRVLADSGEVIYFGNSLDSNLKDLEEREESQSLDKYVVLCPKWMVSAMRCILRHDLKREIMETRNLMNAQLLLSPDHEETAVEALQSCPIVSSNDISLIWRSMEFMRTANHKTSKKTGMLPSSSPALFEFLQQALVHRGVLVPLTSDDCPSLLSKSKGTLFMVPGLLQEPPQGLWSFKTSNAWNTTLCSTWVWENSPPPLGIMDQISSCVLKRMLEFGAVDDLSVDSHKFLDDASQGSDYDSVFGSDETVERIHLKRFLCWKNAFMVVIRMDTYKTDSPPSASTVEIFAQLVRNDSHNAVASSLTGDGAYKLIVSAKGQVGNCGRKIWRGGYDVVLDAVKQVIQGRNEKATFSPSSSTTRSTARRQTVCPECLAQFSAESACSWSSDFVTECAKNGMSHVHCDRAHSIDTSLLCGAPAVTSNNSESDTYQDELVTRVPSKPVRGLLGAVVLVGLWNPENGRIQNVGSGFVADKEKGLVITASHVLFSMRSQKKFGRNAMKVKDGKIVLGVIPQKWFEEGSRSSGPKAVFRYFADVVANGLPSVDACVLRITTKFENDVDDEYGEGIGDQPEIPLRNNSKALKAEQLQHLKLTRAWDMDEDVRLLGCDQGGDGLSPPGVRLNRYFGSARGYIHKRFSACKSSAKLQEEWVRHEKLFRSDNGESLAGLRLETPYLPSDEFVVICPTISGQSGGPCVKQDGTVIGILSRSDPEEKHRCYLVPASELRTLLKKAKSKCGLSPTELYLLSS